MAQKRSFLFPIIVLSISALILPIFYGETAGASRQYDASARVARVGDGDTITIVSGRTREKVRLIGIDAPEMGQRPWGERAKKHLEKLLREGGGSVTLEYDVERRDRYGRLLAYIRTGEGTFINLKMVEDGYAVLFTFPPNVRYVRELIDSQRRARERGLGIWGRDGLRESPRDYRRTHPR